MGYTAVVLGASGYAGGEVLRLLSTHPEIEVTAASADSKAGAAVAEVHPHLGRAAGLRLIGIEEALATGADVCLSCLPGGQLRQVISDVRASVVVDLSDDFRGHEHAGSWVYGLTEHARPALASATRVANPGCYPTAALLCLIPFARARAIGGAIVIDALSGVSGAGRKAEDRLLYSGLAASASAYGTTQHRHVPEIERGLETFAGVELGISFLPHLVPMARGLLVTAHAPLTGPLTDAGALELLSDAYAAEPFVSVVEDWPATKYVSGTNRALVSARVDARNGLLVCSGAIDNLGKGAAGQAVQNANVALGLEEELGLGALAVWP
jgi:N-acetyl-gamma-glutamyl-phosphate reductase